MKRKLTVLLVTMIVFNSIYVFAAQPGTQKSEIVYVNLDTCGNVNLVNVYNNYLIQDKEEVVDYGEYESIQNLTNNDLPTNVTGFTKWDVKDIRRLAYIGTLNNNSKVNIPWNIDLSYSLNGEDVKAEDLLHKSGLIKINISLSANEEANEYFKNNYLLEITSSYDMDEYLSVYSKDAIEVLTGKTKTLMFVVLPGQNKDVDIEIGSDDFSMDGLTFAMVPIKGDILTKIKEISEDKESVEAALDSLNYSTDIILNNMQNMNTGISDITNGTQDLKNGTNELNKLSSTRNENLNQLKEELSQMSSITKNTTKDLDNLQNGVNDINEMLTKTNMKLIDVSKKLKSISNTLDDLSEYAEDIPGGIDKIQKLIKDTRSLLNKTESLINAQIDGSNYDTTTLLTSLQGIKENTENIGKLAKESAQDAAMNEDAANAEKYSQIAKEAQSIGNNLAATSEELQNIQEIISSGTTASSGLVANIKLIENDMLSLEKILGKISEHSEDLSDNIDTLNDTINDMKDIIDIVNEYTNKYLASKDDINIAIENTKKLINELQKLEATSNSMISNLQSAMQIVDDKIYSGINNVSIGMVSVLNNTQNILSQTNNIKTSKNTIRNISKDKIDELSDETNLLKVDPDAKVVSFVSPENDAVTSVQILLKSDGIKDKIIDGDEDLEAQKDNTTIWDKIANIFALIYNWFVKLIGIK